MHTGDVLDLAGDTASDIEFGADSNACLADLAIVVSPTCIDSSAACADFATEHIGELMEHLEILLAAHAIATAYDNGATLEIYLRLLDVTVDHLYDIIEGRSIVISLEVDYYALVVGVVDFLLHDAFADSSHLGAALGVDDSSDDVTAESGADLEEEILIDFAGASIGMVADLELCAVGSQTAMESGRDAWAEVTADRSSTHESDAWFLLLEEIDKERAVGERSIGIKARILHLIESINAVWEHLIFDTGEIVAGYDSFELDTEFIGELATLGEEFKAHISHLTILKFAIND